MKKIVLVLILIIAPVVIYAKGEDLRKIEDDTAFSNGIHFLKLGQKKKGLLVLKEYLEVYIDGNHRGEAYLHIAKLYFEQFDYTQAIATYESLYQEMGSTEEGVQGYYLMGICYQKMGYTEKAKAVFNSILIHHSDTSLAQQARMQLEVMKLVAEGEDRPQPGGK
jgi:TolA-binding protein